MSAQFAVDLVFKSLGVGKLGEAARELHGIDGAAKKAQSSADQLTAAINKQKTSNAALAGNLRQLKVEYDKLTAAAKASAAAGGAGFDEATVSRLRGLSTEIGRTREALNAGKKALGDNQAALAALGPTATGAGAGVRGLGAAFNAALGPIGAVLAGVAGLTKAFQTLSAQNFAEAKVRTLGTDSAVLVAELKKVSAELNGQASVVELTGAAYDVASAGFVKAADAVMVLKAASLGATGGFSDINTVGNAATSVLNAYGLAASEAGLVVDRFIQTQNDGKIVVAEYATNIGKVAAAAAGLGIPLEQVNAVIAQATASGVQAEVAFTGLKSALARLASGEAAKELEGFGIKISAASIESDGLYGTLKKLEGLDTGTLFKVLGTEAAPAMLPVIQNLERYKELIEKQQGSAGAAAAAQKEAANTIQGAWKAVVTEFENLFSNQSELGAVIMVTLQAAAQVVRLFGQSISLLLAPFKSIVTAVVGVASAIDKAFNISGVVQRIQQTTNEIKEIFTNLGTTVSAIWSGFIDELGVALNPLGESWDSLGQWMSEAWSSTTEFISGLWGSTTEFIGTNAEGLGSWIQGVWNGIAGGAQGIIQPITSAFSNAFNAAMGIIQSFWNSLPGWLKGALSAAGSVAGAITGAVTNALGQVGGAIQKGIAGAGKNGAGVKAPAAISYKAPGGGGMTAPIGGGGAAPKGGGGGGGGGGKGDAERAAKEAADKARAIADLQGQVALKEQLITMDRQIFAELQKKNYASAAALEMDKILLERQEKIAAIKRSDADAATKNLQIKQATLEADEQLGKASQERVQEQNEFQESFKDSMNDLQRQIALEGAGSEEARRQLEIQFAIENINKGKLKLSEQQVQAYKDANKELDEARKKAEALKQQQAELQNLYDGIGSQIASGVGGAIDAVAGNVENLGETLQGLAADILKAVGKMLIFYALAQAFGALGGNDGQGFFSMLAKGFGGGRASGGPVEPNTTYLVGEKGPELLQLGSSGGHVYNNEQTTAAMSRYSPAGRRGAAVLDDTGGAAGGGGGAGGGTFTLETVVINRQEYATIEQVRQMGQAAAKQGADGGHSRVMGDFRNKRSTRARVGMR